MKSRITDLICIGLISLFIIYSLFLPEHLGDTLGKIITAVLVILSFFLSWKLAIGQTWIVKVIIYLFQFSLAYSLSTIIIELIIGVSSGMIMNIFIFLIVFMIYYLVILKKLIASLKKTT
jgi:hypothetical protein